MNKRMRELLAKIQSKTKEAKGFMDVENKDIDKANALMDEVDALQKEYDAEKRAFELEKNIYGASATEPIGDSADPKNKDEKLTAEQIIAKEVRAIMNPIKYGNDKSLMESRNENGGFTVPEDISTTINKYPDVEYSFLTDISTENVSTNKGARTYQSKKDAEAFVDLDENGAITNEIDAPRFERINYRIQDRAGFMPVSNDLINDSDANIMNIVTDWLAKSNIATANKNVLGLINRKQPKAVTGLDDIKKIVNIDLGQAYKSGCKIITNDNGLQYLDTLKDTNNRPLLNPDPTNPMNLQLRCGTVVVPVKVVPNKVLNGVYHKTSDTSVVEGKTYYSKRVNTSNNSISYEVVTNPLTDDMSSYYELESIPFIVGDLASGIRRYNRQEMSLMASDVASIGGFNAFAQNMTLIRAILRDDYQVLDEDAYDVAYLDETVKG